MEQERLVLDFALMMVLLLVAPLISTRLRLPDIVGLILAGVLFGQHGLGLFHLDTVFQLLGTVGLLYLMFLAGLEINLNEFRRYRIPSLVFGTLTFLIPQVLGTLGAKYLLGYTWLQSILMASMFASHTLIPFSIVQRLGLGRNRSVTTTIGGTILTDTAALLVLAVVVKLYAPETEVLAEKAGVPEGGIGPWFWIQMVLALSLLVFGAIRLLPPLGYRFFRKLAPDGSGEFIFVLAVAFLTSFAAEKAGVEGIIGAFLAGLALSTLVPERGVLMNRLHFVGHTLFIPFFLFSVGMRVNLRQMWTGQEGWIVAIFMSVCVTATKWFAAQISGRILGYTKDESGVVFGLSINQAAATLAAVLVGVRVGLFDANVLNGTILMILVTCLIGPWMTDRCGRRVAEQEAESPSGPRRESGRILVPISFANNSEQIMDLAMAIRPEQSTEAVYPLNVVLDGPDAATRVAEAERILAGAVGRAIAANTPVIPLARIDLNVGGGILRAATEFRVSAIIIGWQGKRSHLSLKQNILDLLITQADPALLVVRPGPRLNTVERFWVAVPPLVEHHAGFADAVRIIRRLALQAGAKTRYVATEKTHSVLRKLTGGLVGSGGSEEVLESWAEVTNRIGNQFGEQDGIIFLEPRRARLAWHPSLERLPVEWTVRWPEATVIVIYPPNETPEGDEALSEEEKTSSTASESRETTLKPRILHVKSNDLRTALPEMLNACLGGTRADIDTLCESILKTGPVPLSPQITILHTHTPHVETARVTVGVRKEGFRIEGFEDNPTALILLLSPLSGTPEDHLRALAVIAKAARDGSLIPED